MYLAQGSWKWISRLARTKIVGWITRESAWAIKSIVINGKLLTTIKNIVLLSKCCWSIDYRREKLKNHRIRQRSTNISIFLIFFNQANNFQSAKIKMERKENDEINHMTISYSQSFNKFDPILNGRWVGRSQEN